MQKVLFLIVVVIFLLAILGLCFVLQLVFGSVQDIGQEVEERITVTNQFIQELASATAAASPFIEASETIAAANQINATQARNTAIAASQTSVFINATNTVSAAGTLTATNASPTPSITPTITPSFTPTLTLTPTWTPSITPSPTDTYTPVPSLTPTATLSPLCRVQANLITYYEMPFEYLQPQIARDANVEIYGVMSDGVWYFGGIRSENDLRTVWFKKDVISNCSSLPFYNNYRLLPNQLISETFSNLSVNQWEGTTIRRDDDSYRLVLSTSNATISEPGAVNLSNSYLIDWSVSLRANANRSSAGIRIIGGENTIEVSIRPNSGDVCWIDLMINQANAGQNEFVCDEQNIDLPIFVTIEKVENRITVQVNGNIAIDTPISAIPSADKIQLFVSADNSQAYFGRLFIWGFEGRQE